MEVKDIPIKDGEKQFDLIDKGDVLVLRAFWGCSQWDVEFE